MSESHDDVVVQSYDGLAHVELNRPEALNAWTPEMGALLLERLREVGADPDVRAVVITGAGRAFCAGADVKNEREVAASGVPDLSGRLRDIYNPIVLTVRSMPKPVVASVHGACAGLGVSLALASDLVVAADDAYFLLAFVRIAVMPDGGSTAMLVERIGLARAMQLCLLGERLPAPRAVEWGLINETHPLEQLQDAAFGLGRRLAEGPTVALGNMKRALHAAATANLAHHLDFEAALQFQHGNTADYAEGRAAFSEKRPAHFLGR